MLRRFFTATNGFAPYTLADVQEAIRAYAKTHKNFGPNSHSGDVVINGHRTSWSVVNSAANNKMIPGAENFKNLEEIVCATGFKPEPKRHDTHKLELTADQVEERQLQWKKETGSYATYGSGPVLIAGVWTNWCSINHSFRAAHNPKAYKSSPISGGEKFKNLKAFTDHIINKRAENILAPPVKGTVYVANGMYGADFLEQCGRRYLAKGGDLNDFQYRSTILSAETGLTVGEATQALREGKVTNLGEDEFVSTYFEFFSDRYKAPEAEEPEVSTPPPAEDLRIA
jgi:hypothetical protein